MEGAAGVAESLNGVACLASCLLRLRHLPHAHALVDSAAQTAARCCIDSKATRTPLFPSRSSHTITAVGASPPSEAPGGSHAATEATDSPRRRHRPYPC